MQYEAPLTSKAVSVMFADKNNFAGWMARHVKILNIGFTDFNFVYQSNIRKHTILYILLEFGYLKYSRNS